MNDLILGSQSPRRKEIFSFFALPFRQIAPNIKEEFDTNSPPEKVAIDLAQKKGNCLHEQFPLSEILTADTIVVLEDRIYGKPTSPEEGSEMLAQLSGKWHTVITGLAFTLPDRQLTDYSSTKVKFRTLTPQQIKAYHSQLHFWDKAGGYAIQGAGGIVVEKIEGCFYNVMGLPLQPLVNLFEEAGVSLWQKLS